MGFLSDLFGGGNDHQVVTQRADIPAFLQPYLSTAASTGRTALNRLGGLVNSTDTVAPFTDYQNQAFDLAAQRAMGDSGFFPAAQDQAYQTALGRDVNSLLPESVLSGLSGFGAGIDSFMPSASLDALTSGFNIPSAATNAFMSATGFNLNPTATNALNRGATMSGVPVQATNAAGEVINGDLLPQSARGALESTASGNHLFGGQGFDQAVDAAVRAARPGILSTFKNAGVGGATGGLAQAAIGKAAVDAFANQFGQERQNQLSAANALGNFGISGGNQKLSAAGLLGDLGLSGNAQQLGAAQSLANLGLSENSQRLAGAGGLADTSLASNAQRLSGATTLAGLSNSERNRQLQAGTTQAGLLGGLADSERSRALQSALALPGLATADIDLLSRIGGIQQGQNQRELTAPIDAQTMLAQLAMGAPLSGTIGSATTTPVESNLLGNVLGGASTGFSMFGPMGALGGGLLGGLLG